jgi:hexosaminidase
LLLGDVASVAAENTTEKTHDAMSVVPRPVLAQPLAGEPLVLDAATAVKAGPGVPAELVQRAVESLRWATGIDLKDNKGTPSGSGILLRLGSAVGTGRPDWQAKEAYRLSASARGVEIIAQDGHGLFNGIQTLAQLAAKGTDGKWTVPPVKIEDYPRFPWRGYLLDPARDFRAKAEILRIIDLLAFHKLNVLQLHLTDDQGWRVEIPRYPKLTEIGARLPNSSGQKGEGWFYSRADVAEIVRYAAQRFVTVVPEIEMPGHSGAATTAYPELGCQGRPSEELCVGKEATSSFAANVLDEFMAQFPSPYIHVGADEVQPEHWRACPVCKARMEALAREPLPSGVTPVRVRVTNGAGRPFHEDIGRLQGEFVRRIDQHLRSKGRRMVGWDEILDGGLAGDSRAVVMAWRSAGAIAGAAGQNRDVVAAIYPEYYLDNQIPLAQTYAYEPAENMPVTLRQHLLGVQGNMWGLGTPTLQRVYEQTFPRLCALAETGWTPREARDFDDFMARLKPHARRLEKEGVRIKAGR